jgi:hypothetical protein
MAKHIIGKKVSKGQRRSGGAITPAAPKPFTGNMNNAMREALLNTQVDDNMRFSRLGNLAIKAIQHAPKLSAAQEKGWSTNLSYRTFTALKAQGVIA